MRQRKGNPLADNMRAEEQLRKLLRRRWGGAGVYIAPSVIDSKKTRQWPRVQSLQSHRQSLICPCARLIRRRRLSSSAALKRNRF